MSFINPKVFTFVLIIVFNGTLWSQKKEIEVKYRKSADQVILTATNNTKYDLELTFSLEVKNLKGYKEPITKVIKSNFSEDIFTLTSSPGKKWSYNYKYFKKIIFNDDLATVVAKKLEIPKEEIENGILIFDKEGCTRCDYTIESLNSKKIPFKVLNITKDRESADIMYQYLSKAGFNLSRVTTPVVIVSGKPHYNIQNLETFVQGLKKYKKETRANR
jgi:glutaredoxin